jgi:hypothetical protein
VVSDLRGKSIIGSVAYSFATQKKEEFKRKDIKDGQASNVLDSVQ